MSIISALRSSARRSIAAGLTGAAGLAILAAPLATADAAPTCYSTDICISNVSVHGEGHSASIVFDTQQPTQDTFEVSYDNTVVATGYSTAQYSLHHQITTPGLLDPNRTYTWLLVSRQANGRTQSMAGSVTTLHRQVDVQFTTITVTDDSDYNSAGDFKTWVRAGNVSGVDYQVPDTISDGQTVLATDLLRVRDAGNTLPVYTEMVDNDTFNPFLPGASWPGSNPFFAWSNGSNLFYDWGTATTTLDVANPYPGLHPFQMSIQTNGGSPAGVGFIVHGYYSVTYVS